MIRGESGQMETQIEAVVGVWAFPYLVIFSTVDTES